MVLFCISRIKTQTIKMKLQKYSRRLERPTQCYLIHRKSRFTISMASRVLNKAVVEVAVAKDSEGNQPSSRVMEVAVDQEWTSICSRLTIFSDSSLVVEIPLQTFSMMISDFLAWVVDNKDNSSNSSRETTNNNSNSSKGNNARIHSEVVDSICSMIMTISSIWVAASAVEDSEAEDLAVEIACSSRCTRWDPWVVEEAEASSKCRCSLVVQAACLVQALNPRSPLWRMASVWLARRRLQLIATGRQRQRSPSRQMMEGVIAHSNSTWLQAMALSNNSNIRWLMMEASKGNNNNNNLE